MHLCREVSTLQSIDWHRPIEAYCHCGLCHCCWISLCALQLFRGASGSRRGGGGFRARWRTGTYCSWPGGFPCGVCLLLIMEDGLWVLRLFAMYCVQPPCSPASLAYLLWLDCLSSTTCLQTVQSTICRRISTTPELLCPFIHRSLCLPALAMGQL